MLPSGILIQDAILWSHKKRKWDLIIAFSVQFLPCMERGFRIAYSFLERLYLDSNI